MELKYLGTNGKWSSKGLQIHSTDKNTAIGQSFVQKNLLDLKAEDIEAHANAQMMSASLSMYETLLIVKDYINENVDVLAPFPTRSVMDCINFSIRDAIYVPKPIEITDPIGKNGLPQSINDVIPEMTDVEIRNFFKAEHAMHMRCRPISEYILGGKEDFTMGERHNKVEKAINSLIVIKFLEK